MVILIFVCLSSTNDENWLPSELAITVDGMKTLERARVETPSKTVTTSTVLTEESWRMVETTDGMAMIVEIIGGTPSKTVTISTVLMPTDEIATGDETAIVEIPIVDTASDDTPTDDTAIDDT